MKHRRLAVAAATMAVAAGSLCASVVAYAEPVAPQAGASCPDGVDGALTKLSDTSVLECRDGLWRSFTDPYPSSDRWLSYGPALSLHGQGMRNPEIISGEWTGYPQDSGGQCRAEQAAVVSAGEVGPPQVSTGEPGQPLQFEVLPVVFTIEMSGNCLWQKSD